MFQEQLLDRPDATAVASRRKGATMRRNAILVLILLVVIGTLLGARSVPGQASQVTPAASGVSNVTVEVLGRGPSSVAPGYGLQLIRLTFAPGGSIALHRHPGDAVFFVESGAIAWTTGEGQPLLTRAAAARAAAASTPSPPEPLAPGQEVTLEAGDAVFYDGATTHAVRNDGTEPAVVLYAALRAADQPGIEFVATPAA
jgi:quercetin dioxygenase-like cupin family protein